MVNEEHLLWLPFAEHSLQRSLALKGPRFAEIRAIQRNEIKSGEAWLSAAKQQVVKPWTPSII